LRALFFSGCLFLHCASVYLPGTPGGDWSKDEVLAVKAKLRMSFAKPWGMPNQANTALGTTDPGDNGGNYNAAKVLRLTFHDCLKYTDGTGGCDGCLNWKGVGTRFEDAPNKNLYADVGDTDNNGLRHTVEVLEAIYTVPGFPSRSPVLAKSLKDSGKSRADLWALAGIVAVEYGIETNNMKCDDPSSVSGCHHLQGQSDCRVNMTRTIPFRTGRADCVVTDEARPYIASKHEAHPNSVGDGPETIKFFQDNFGFTGQETVAIMGAHTFGRLHVHTSLFRYVWTSRGTNFFNNDYYKMITDEKRWFYDDDACTPVGDAYNNKPVRRWTAHYRGDTTNNGPVHWISENYVCPNCARNINADHSCCQNIPEGNFCVPDALNMTEKTPNQLSQPWKYCEAYRFISGIDEMALPCEMGLYFEFQNRGNGFPTGCPGLENFDGTNWQTWSSINWVKADPQCNLQPMSLPAEDQPTSWYMREYAVNQTRFIDDFISAFDKMLSNGYTSLSQSEDQSTGIECTSQPDSVHFSQCYESGSLDENTQYIIINQLDNRVVQMSENGAAQMATRDDTNMSQRWMLKAGSGNVPRGQFVNVANNKLLTIYGLSDFTIGLQANAQGFYTIRATGGIHYDNNQLKNVAWDRGWNQNDGQGVNVWNEHGAVNQRWKLEVINM